MVWFEAATVVPMAPPVDVPAGSVLKSALAGGLASALSTSLLHPLDTVKTRLQASTLSFPEVIARLPQIGVRGMYQGSIPAVLGQFTRSVPSILAFYFSSVKRQAVTAFKE
jgi:hypothetical protein